MKSTLSTLTAVTHVPTYRAVEWDWLEDGLCCFDFEGTDCYTPEQRTAMFEKLKEVINSLTAYHESDNRINVLYDLVDNFAEGGEEQEEFEVAIVWDETYRSRSFHMHMPFYPLFDQSVYSALAMFAYQVADAVQDNSCIRGIYGNM